MNSADQVPIHAALGHIAAPPPRGRRSSQCPRGIVRLLRRRRGGRSMASPGTAAVGLVISHSTCSHRNSKPHPGNRNNRTHSSHLRYAALPCGTSCNVEQQMHHQISRISAPAARGYARLPLDLSRDGVPSCARRTAGGLLVYPESRDTVGSDCALAARR